MKKFLKLALVSFLLFSSVSVSANEELTKMAQEAGYPATVDIAPKSAIVIDAETGQLVLGYDVDLQRDPASTTKTMVIYLTMEAIKAGQISMDTEVVATENDQRIAEIYALSNNDIRAGVSYTVSELLTMTFVPSSNVTTLMLAHLIFDGTDGEFVGLMNQTAQELGMTNTVFHNGTGAVVEAFEGYYAPEGYDHTLYNLTTTKDLATLTYHLVKKHPEVLEFTKDTEVTVKAGTPYEETFESYNHSLPGDEMGIEGVDGLKTGSSPSAGYNSIVTAKRGDQRYIAVVMGVSQWGDPEGEFVRHYFVNGLLEHAFANYEKREVLSAGKHKIDGVTYQLSEPLTAVLKKDEETPGVSVEDGRLLVSGVSSVDLNPGLEATPSKSLLSGLSTKTEEKTTVAGLGIFDWLVFGLLGGIILILLLVIALMNRKAKK